MDTSRPIWLVDNSSSGSNDQEALRLLEETCGDAGFHVAHRTQFPRYDLPNQAMLDAAGIETLAVFAGDGTINAAINHLAGWGGAVLVLRGGTMNLLYHRLHGQREMAEVIAAAAAGRTLRTRPAIVRTGDRRALAGLMAGPGTSWNHVREAMRENSILHMAEHTIEALGQTMSGAMIICAEPPLGRREGYPLVLLTPGDEGIEVLAYHAETAKDYLGQTVALLKRDFREGPHDKLGYVQRLVLAGVDGKPFGMLVDGEPALCEETEVVFELAACEVDLLATEAVNGGDVAGATRADVGLATGAAAGSSLDAGPAPHG